MDRKLWWIASLWAGVGCAQASGLPLGSLNEAGDGGQGGLDSGHGGGAGGGSDQAGGTSAGGSSGRATEGGTPRQTYVP